MNAIPILLVSVIQYQALAAPVLVPPQASVDGGGSKRLGTVPYVQYQAHAAPVVVPNVLEAPSTVPPIYPSRIFPRRRLQAALHQDWTFDVQWEAPTAVTVPELILSQDSAVVRRRYSRAPYAPFKPSFGVEVRVPVLSWTGHYPDRLPVWAKTHHASRSSVLAWDTVLGPVVVVAPDLAVPGYPDRVYARPRVVQFPDPAWPPFVADVTVSVPVSSWHAEYPERVRPRTSLLAAQQQAWTMWPYPIPVVAVSEVFGRGRYTVPPRPRTFTVPPRPRDWTV